jgi:hypothetical protein
MNPWTLILICVTTQQKLTEPRSVVERILIFTGVSIMFFDTKSVLLAAFALVSIPFFAGAQSQPQSKFPFDVQRDSSGTLTRIELPLRDSVLSIDDDALTQLRTSLKQYQDSSTVGVTSLSPDTIKPQTDNDQKLFEQAKTYLKNDLSMSTLSDPNLANQYALAKPQILKVKLFRLLAAPNTIDAFDRERAITEVTQQLIDNAGSILGVGSPALTVFTFLVDQYIESLESRRDFFQNQLLVLLANDHSLFTSKEKSLIRSSIFYSRLDFLAIDLHQRSNARKDWPNYGDNQLAATLKPCKGFVKQGENSFGSCFKQVGDLFVNRMVKKNKLSGSVSLAFDSKNPSRVRDFRALVMLANLGTRFVPGGTLVTKPLRIWLDGLYVNQRKSEGYFFGYTNLRNQTDLSNWILMNSANPIINH